MSKPENSVTCPSCDGKGYHKNKSSKRSIKCVMCDGKGWIVDIELL